MTLSRQEEGSHATSQRPPPKKEKAQPKGRASFAEFLLYTFSIAV